MDTFRGQIPKNIDFCFLSNFPGDQISFKIFDKGTKGCKLPKGEEVWL